jgi:hypothetical protein
MYEERGDEAFEFYEKAFARTEPYLKALTARLAAASGRAVGSKNPAITP